MRLRLFLALFLCVLAISYCQSNRQVASPNQQAASPNRNQDAEDPATRWAGSYAAGEGPTELTSPPPRGPATVVINEIMIQPEFEGPKFVELHNPGTSAFDLSGYRFTAGVAFTFPAGSGLPPGGYGVVSSNVDAFRARYPRERLVFGGFEEDQIDSSDRLVLCRPDGNVADVVRYRRAQTGTGASLELGDPYFTNAPPESWVAGPWGGTPSARNQANASPMAQLLKQRPLRPTPRANVTITARATPATKQLTLLWRKDGPPPLPAFKAAQMRDDGSSGDGAAGDGVFGAILSLPDEDGGVYAFRVAAAETSESRP